MKKTRRIKPSARIKKRYFVINSADKEKIKNAISSSLKQDYPNAHLKFIFVDFSRQKSMICANRKFVQQIKSALLSAGLKCIGISGTIKKARQKFWCKN
jgi:RNase P/RNase MRP subunit POP5